MLLPIGVEHHPNLRLLRCIESADAQTLTIFIKDKTYAQDYSEVEDAMFSGFMAVCERFPDADFFITTVYHEWYVLPSLAKQLAPGSKDST